MDSLTYDAGHGRSALNDMPLNAAFYEASVGRESFLTVPVESDSHLWGIEDFAFANCTQLGSI
jgi:hypothetical protein